MPTTTFKAQLKDELVQMLEDDLVMLERAQADAQSGATHGEAKQEDDKDTRAIEQQYLARGQAMRVEELRLALADVRRMSAVELPDDAPVGLGTLVTIDEDGKEYQLYLAPHRGGTMLAGGKVQVVTPKSPLGNAILGAHAGDDCEAHAQRVRELTVLSVT